MRTEGAFGNRVSVLFFSLLFEESGGETGSHIGSSALCSKDGLNTPGARLLLPGARITGLHRHTQFMQGWESKTIRMPDKHSVQHCSEQRETEVV